MRKTTASKSFSTTLLLVDVSTPVLAFVSEVDMITDDLSWDVSAWIMGYNLYYSDKYSGIHDLTEHYILTCIPRYRECEHPIDREKALLTLDDIAKLAESYLYPDLHRYFTYSDEERPIIHTFLNRFDGTEYQPNYSVIIREDPR